jgi:Protein of unknown function (DUF4232)
MSRSRSLLMGAAVAGAAAVAAAPAPSAASAALPRCHSGGLSASLGRFDAGAGQRDVRLTLRNRSGHTCRTQGWVGMQLRRGGHDVRTNVVREQGPSHRVVLRAGERAVATLHWTVVPAPSEPQSGACEPTARHVLITPPDEVGSLRIRWTGGPVCQRGRIDATPLRHR